MSKVRKGDNVVVIAGRDKGKRGDVTRVFEDHVLVNGINEVKKHQRPNPMKGEQGGIVTKEMPIHVSNVAIWNPITQKADRIGTRMLECLAEWLTPSIYHWLGVGEVVERSGMRHNLIVPYGVYACADGAVNFAIQNDGQWRRFCAGVYGDPALAADPRFAVNPDRLRNRAVLEQGGCGSTTKRNPGLR